MGTLWVVALLGCTGGAEVPDEPEVPEKCKNVHVDRLDIDWIAVRGETADPKTRVRITRVGDGYEAWYVGGFFTKHRLVGEKRADDVKFTEVPTGARKASFDAGDGTVVRAYLKPALKDCAVHAFVGKVDKKGKEEVPPRPFDLLPFPEQGVTFSYQGADEPLFLGAAASDAKARDAQLAEAGGPSPEAEMGTVPVGTWSAVEADGDPACTYDMDLYFDDQMVAELSPKPAGDPVDGQRHWFHEWEAPYSGNHHFEMHRHRTCTDGKRELIAIAAIEAVLM